MIGRSNHAQPDATTQRAAHLHRMALQQALRRIAAPPRRPADHPPDAHTSTSIDATIAALNAESIAATRAIDLSHAADAAMAQVGDRLKQAQQAGGDKQLDPLLDEIDRIGQSASVGTVRLLDGALRLSAPDQAFVVSAVSTTSLGQRTIGGRRCCLADLRQGAALGAAPDAAPAVLDAAVDDLTAQRQALRQFTDDALRRNLTDIAARRAHLLATAALTQTLGGELDLRG
jgi:flagellin-like hook-associated protein FlgL